MSYSNVFLIACIMCTLVSIHGAAELSAWTTYDKPMKFTCPANSFMTGVESVFMGGKMDRKFRFGCTKMPEKAILRDCAWTPKYVNAYDKKVDFKCPVEQVMTGIESIHSNKFEDRIFKFQCCTAVGVRPANCQLSEAANAYREAFTFKVPEGKVITGMTSCHHNGLQDRVFKFQVCTMVPSCS